VALAVVGAQGHPITGVVDGKALFLDNKCNTCHTIKSDTIEKRKAAATDAVEAKTTTTAKKPPDLSSVGLAHNAEWMAKYLMKTEAIKGEKHGRKFRGTEPELKVLASWLETHKAPKAK
jgi:hypothetical protein